MARAGYADMASRRGLKGSCLARAACLRRGACWRRFCSLLCSSRVAAKVAVLKPLSSAIVVGSGGPFGAEGPIIMTGGAIGSLIAQCVKVTSAERKTLLVAGAAAGMTAVFGTPVAAVLLAVELLLFEWRPRSFLPVAVA